MSTLIVKMHLHRKRGDELRRFAAPATYEELESIVSHLWGSTTRRLCIEYVDLDGDKVRMSTSLEWDECVRLFQEASVGGFCPTPTLVLHATRGPRRNPTATGESSDDEYKYVPSGISIVTAASSAPSRGVSVAPVAAAASPSPAIQQLATPLLPAAATALKPDDDDSDATAPLPVGVAAGGPRTVTIAGATPDDARDILRLLSTLFVVDAEKILASRDRIPKRMFRVISRRTNGPSAVLCDLDRAALLAMVTEASSDQIKKGSLVQAGVLLSEAINVFPGIGSLYYNQACMHARAANVEGALSSLEAALAFGYKDIHHMRSDPDLVSVRTHPRFLDLTRQQDQAKYDATVMRMLELVPHLTPPEARKFLTDASGDLEHAVNLAYDATSAALAPRGRGGFGRRR